MESQPKMHGTPNPTPIIIDGTGTPRPLRAPISISANGGAKFNVAARACTLTFSPSCPFQGAVGNDLSLPRGDNQVKSLINGVTEQTYKYTVALDGHTRALDDDPAGPRSKQFDVIVSP
jgi:hypothetical protein